jgi:hypothetical protein
MFCRIFLTPRIIVLIVVSFMPVLGSCKARREGAVSSLMAAPSLPHLELSAKVKFPAIRGLVKLKRNDGVVQVAHVPLSGSNRKLQFEEGQAAGQVTYGTMQDLGSGKESIDIFSNSRKIASITRKNEGLVLPTHVTYDVDIVGVGRGKAGGHLRGSTLTLQNGSCKLDLVPNWFFPGWTATIANSSAVCRQVYLAFISYHVFAVNHFIRMN